MLISALVAIAIVVIVGVFIGFRRSTSAPEIGGIYTTFDGRSSYTVVKVLAHADGITHVRLYKQKFSSRPATVEVASLSLGRIDEPGGFGIGHLPIRDETFQQWQPVLITKSTVTPDELAGYKMWKEDAGGVL